MPDPTFDRHPTEPRWTHIALRVADIEATIAWYLEFTPLEVLARNQDDHGFGAWMGMADTADHPFIFVVAQFLPGQDPFKDSPYATLRPFAHLGIELPSRDAVDEMAELGRAHDCIQLEPTMMPPPVGYITMLTDPDGNTVEFSWDQGVYSMAHREWGDKGQ